MKSYNLKKTYFKHDQLAWHDKNKIHLILSSHQVVRSIILLISDIFLFNIFFFKKNPAILKNTYSKLNQFAQHDKNKINLNLIFHRVVGSIFSSTDCLSVFIIFIFMFWLTNKNLF